MSIGPIAFDALTRVLTGLHEYTIVTADDTLNSLAVRVTATTDDCITVRDLPAQPGFKMFERSRVPIVSTLSAWPSGPCPQLR